MFLSMTSYAIHDEGELLIKFMWLQSKAKDSHWPQNYRRSRYFHIFISSCLQYVWLQKHFSVQFSSAIIIWA